MGKHLILFAALASIFTAVLLKPGTTKKFPGQVMCPKNQISDWTVDNNTATECRECPRCGRGRGSTYSCGDVKKFPSTKPIQCEKCVKGKTFSSRQSTDMCSPCTICPNHRTVLQKCTRRNDTICGGCEKGFYEYQNEIGIRMCEKCSPCCDDGNDKRVKECVEQGLPSDQVCSFLDEERCTKSSDYKVIRRSYQPSATTAYLASSGKASSKSTTRPEEAGLSAGAKLPQIPRPDDLSNIKHPTTPQISTRPNANNIINNSNKNNINIQTGVHPLVVAVVVVVAAIAIGLLSRCVYKKKKRSRKDRERRDGEEADQPLRQSGDAESPQGSSANESPLTDDRVEVVDLSCSDEDRQATRRSDDEESPEDPSIYENPLSRVQIIVLNRNADDRQANEPSVQSSLNIELQPVDGNGNEKDTVSKAPSTTVNEYLEDSQRHNQPAVETITSFMDTDNAFLRDFKSFVCLLGVKQSKANYLKITENEHKFEALLEYLRACKDPPATLEEIAMAVQRKGYEGIAKLIRMEDERLQKTKQDQTQMIHETG